MYECARPLVRIYIFTNITYTPNKPVKNMYMVTICASTNSRKQTYFGRLPLNLSLPLVGSFLFQPRCQCLVGQNLGALGFRPGVWAMLSYNYIVTHLRAKNKHELLPTAGCQERRAASSSVAEPWEVASVFVRAKGFRV